MVTAKWQLQPMEDETWQQNMLQNDHSVCLMTSQAKGTQKISHKNKVSLEWLNACAVYTRLSLCTAFWGPGNEAMKGYAGFHTQFYAGGGGEETFLGWDDAVCIEWCPSGGMPLQEYLEK